MLLGLMKTRFLMQSRLYSHYDYNKTQSKKTLQFNKITIYLVIIITELHAYKKIKYDFFGIYIRLKFKFYVNKLSKNSYLNKNSVLLFEQIDARF